MIEWDALLSMIELSRLAKVWLSLVKKLNPTKSNLAHQNKSNKKRKASAPFQTVICFPLCQHMLLCWKAPIMLVIMPA